MKTLDQNISFKETPIGFIPFDWDLKKLKELTNRIYTGTTPPANIREYQTNGVNFLRSQNVFDHYIDSANIVRLNEESISHMRSYEIQSGDVLLNITGDGITFLRCCKIYDNLLPAFANQSMAIIRTNNKLNSDFLALFLSLEKIKEYMEGFNSGSARRTLAAKHVQEYLIPIPPMNEQKVISSIFKEIQNKIDSNTQTNKILESIAHSLFSSWFVKFAPFQNREFFNSELGLIPVGWKVKTVKQLIIEQVLDKPKDGNHGEIHPKHDDFIKEGIPFIMAKDLINNSIDTANCKFISEKQAKSLRKGFSIEGDVLMSHKATIGRTSLVPKIEWDFVILTPQVTYYRVLESEILSNIYLLYYFRSRNFQELFKSWARKGSTRLYLGITDQQNLPILIPSKGEMKRFHNFLSPLVKRIQQNAQENIILSSFRDLFLPQLLSGKLRIKDSEHFLEDVKQ